MDSTLGPFQLDSIVTGDAKILALDIPDESIDLILCDPVYQNIDDYRWLSETAARVLKPNSACLAFCGIGYLPETHDAMRAGGLTYRWRIIVRPVWANEFHGRLIVGTQECLWYEKGHSRLYESIFDLQMSVAKGVLSVGNANWGKGVSAIKHCLISFTVPGSIVLDPFCGGGTVPAVCKQLGLHYLAFEIVPEVAEIARKRVSDMQPPLFVTQGTQMMLMEAI